MDAFGGKRPITAHAAAATHLGTTAGFVFARQPFQGTLWAPLQADGALAGYAQLCLCTGCGVGYPWDSTDKLTGSHPGNLLGPLQPANLQYWKSGPMCMSRGIPIDLPCEGPGKLEIYTWKFLGNFKLSGDSF